MKFHYMWEKKTSVNQFYHNSMTISYLFFWGFFLHIAMTKKQN